MRWCLVFLVVLAAVVICGGEMTLKLERAFPTSHDGMKLSELKVRDQFRHGRMLQSLNGVVNLPVEGSYDPFSVGLYFAKILLGTPPKEFYVQIDTGSDALWVSCASCTGCPTSSGLQIQLEYFDPSTSSTASFISCSDRRCSLGDTNSHSPLDDPICSDENQCSYSFKYGDLSGTSGHYMSDYIHFDTILETEATSNASVEVVFGCSTTQTGDLTESDRAVDGIFGFGQQGFSVISQLSSQGMTPNAFSHCLKGSSDGGGILVLGPINEPNIVYTPLVPSQAHYNLDLQSITVNGQILPIDPSVFATGPNHGTIIDSGTTLAYLTDEAFDPFVKAITQSVLQSVRPFASKGVQCYLVTSSISEVFPIVSFNFAGGASMILKPEDYLLQQNSISGEAVWCMGFQKSQGPKLTILGDLVLKDKIVVYDLDGQQIGWTSYDCSQSVNVSTTTSSGKKEFVNAGQINKSCSRYDLNRLITICFIALLLHLSVFDNVMLYLDQ